MTKIKICGIRRIEDVDAVNKYIPDYIGFVFAKGRTRQVTAEEADSLRKRLKTEIKSVGVFVDNDEDYIAELANRGIINLVQLHGNESEECIKRLRKITGLPVIKAVSVNCAEDIMQWKNSEADYLLYDNGAGGTGKSFDWSLIKNIGKPFFLAGGININNISGALSYRPYAVDISGGVETGGFKDEDKIRKIIEFTRKEKE